MPLYDYRCQVCKHEFQEFIHSISKADEAIVECPNCKVTTKNRLLSTGCKHQFKPGSFFEPYVATDIHPEGKPIKIETQQQFFAECEKHGRGYRPIRDKLR